MFSQEEQKNNSEEKTPLSFFGLLTFFLLLLLVSPLLPYTYETYFVNITFSFLIIVSTATLNYHRAYFYGALAFASLAIFLNTINLFQDTFWFELTSTVASIVIIGAITLLLFERVFFSKKFKADLVFGSVCVYLLLGTLWALVYSLIHLCEPTSFQGMDELVTNIAIKEHPFRLQPFLYFSFVTQTTLGYGDISPTTPFTHSLAIVQATMGQFYMAVLVAGIVGILVKKKS